MNNFGQLSEYMINESKSICSEFNIFTQTKLVIMKVIPAIWQVNDTRYFGIRLYRIDEQMICKYIKPIIKYMEDKCQLWENYKLSWFGRIAAIKMALLLRLISVLLNLGTSLPDVMVNRSQAIINRFTWSKKRPRLKFVMVEKKPQNRGIAIQNFKKYFQAGNLVTCIDWWELVAADMK